VTIPVTATRRRATWRDLLSGRTVPADGATPLELQPRSVLLLAP
jgi:hypothetical protein